MKDNNIIDKLDLNEEIKQVEVNTTEPVSTPVNTETYDVTDKQKDDNFVEKMNTNLRDTYGTQTLINGTTTEPSYNAEEIAKKDNAYAGVSMWGTTRQHPELATTSKDLKGDGTVDILGNPELNKLYNDSDSKTKSEIRKAYGTDEAIKIAKRRMIVKVNEKEIAKDSLGTQIGYSILNGVYSLDMLFPWDKPFKLVKGAKAIAKIGERTRNAIAGGTVTGGHMTANEASFDIQGYDVNYIQNVGIATLFGSGISMLAKVKVGPAAKEFEESLNSGKVKERVEGDITQRDGDFIHRKSVNAEGDEVTTKYNVNDNIKTKGKAKEGTPEYENYKKEAFAKKEADLKNKGVKSKEDLQNMKITDLGNSKKYKDISNSAPKWSGGKNIKFKNEFSKLIYNAASKSTDFKDTGVLKSKQATEILDELLDLPSDIKDTIFTEMKLKAKNGEEVDVFDIYPNIDNFSKKKRGYYNKIEKDFKDNFEANIPEVEKVETIQYEPDTDTYYQFVEQESSSIFDKIPLIRALRSDAIIVGKSMNDYARSIAAKITPNVIASRGKSGQLISINKSGMEVKKEVESIMNMHESEMESLHNKAVENGYKGDLEKFNTEANIEYKQAVNEQELGAAQFANDLYEQRIAPILKEKNKLQAERQKIANQQGKEIGDIKIQEDIISKQIEDLDKLLFDDKFLEDARAKLITELETAKLNKTNVDYEPELFRIRQEIRDLETTSRNTVRNQLKDEYYRDNKLQYDSDILKPGADKINKYYHDIAKKGFDMDLDGMKSYNPNKGYSPRTWNMDNWSKIGTKESRIELLYKGMIKHPDNLQTKKTKKTITTNVNGKKVQETIEVETRLLTDKEIRVMAEELEADIFKMSVSGDNPIHKIFTSNNLPFGTHLKNKNIKIDEDFVQELLLRDYETDISLYNYRMSGRIAVQHTFGTSDITEIVDNFLNENAKSATPATAEEIKALTNMVEDLMGTLRISKDKDGLGMSMVRVMKQYNTLRMGGGFGLNQIVEITGAVLANSLNPYMYVGAGKMLKKTWDNYLTGKGGGDFINTFRESGLMTAALKRTRKNKHGDVGSEMYNMGAVEQILDKMNNVLMNINGLKALVDMSEGLIGTSIMNRIKAGKFSKTEAARWGLLNTDIAKLRKNLTEHVDFENNKIDLENFDDDSYEALLTAINRGVGEMVIQADSIHLPTFMKIPQGFTMLLTQFLRFPLIAHNVLLKKGFTDDQAKLAANMFGSSMAFLGIKYIREQVGVQLGIVDELDMKHDYWNNPDDLTKTFMQSINYLGGAGMLSSLFNYSMIMTGNSELGSEYVSRNGLEDLAGPSAGVIRDMAQMSQAIADGKTLSERQLKLYKRYIPYMNLPWISEAFDTLAEEHGY